MHSLNASFEDIVDATIHSYIYVLQAVSLADVLAH
jgi:hypothetical protein